MTKTRENAKDPETEGPHPQGPCRQVRRRLPILRPELRGQDHRLPPLRRSKRIHRKVDLKRDVPATGVVERVEYDPTRSFRVALVRWIDGVNDLLCRYHVLVAATSPAPAGEVLESSPVSSSFSLASLPGNIGQRVVNRISSSQAKVLPKNYVLIGDVPKQTWIGQVDVKIEAESPPLSSNFPRIAVAGAKPSFFALRAATGDDLIGKNVSFGEIQRWKN